MLYEAKKLETVQRVALRILEFLRQNAAPIMCSKSLFKRIAGAIHLISSLKPVKGFHKSPFTGITHKCATKGTKWRPSAVSEPRAQVAHHRFPIWELLRAKNDKLALKPLLTFAALVVVDQVIALKQVFVAAQDQPIAELIAEILFDP